MLKQYRLLLDGDNLYIHNIKSSHKYLIDNKVTAFCDSSYIKHCEWYYVEVSIDSDGDEYGQTHTLYEKVQIHI